MKTKSDMMTDPGMALVNYLPTLGTDIDGDSLQQSIELFVCRLKPYDTKGEKLREDLPFQRQFIWSDLLNELTSLL